jgi:multidrug efflux pump subunit AcrA (membrane-fusion protein)
MKKIALKGLLIVAIVVALCIFFSGTIRTMTTPKVRFAQVRMGKMEMVTELTGKVVFPETEEWRLKLPEGVSLTVTAVRVSKGDRVKKGATMLNARVTDGEKTLESLRTEVDTAWKELRELEKKTGEIRLTQQEQQWQAAWEAEDEARTAERNARVDLTATLVAEDLELTEDGKLPEGAKDETKALFDTWKIAEKALNQASAKLSELDRYAIPNDIWSPIQKMKEYRKKIETAEKKMTEIQVLMKTTEKITAPRDCYIASLNVEKGGSINRDTLIAELTAEGKDPVIRVDLTDLKQEVENGANLTVIAEKGNNPTTKIIDTGLTPDGHPYADAEITNDVTYALGNVAAMMKNDLKTRLVTRAKTSTCLLPATAVRGSGSNRFVYVGENRSSTFGGNQIVVRKVNVTVLAESGATVSINENMTDQRILYMEDRALNEGGTVMEYMKEAAAK